MSIVEASTLAVSFTAIAVSIWSVIFQSRQSRIHATRVHEERAIIVKTIFEKQRAFREAFDAFRIANDQKQSHELGLKAAQIQLDLYHYFKKQDHFFTYREQKDLYRGLEAGETAHKMIREIQYAYWQAKSEGGKDPDTDPRSQKLVQDLKKREKALAKDWKMMSKLLSKSIGLQ